jgi:hypothetical protein
MNQPNKTFLRYSEIRKRLHAHFLAQSEVPVEHAVSLPLPTRRCGMPGYAFFASPAVRLSGKPVEQGAPDRWWVFGAENGRLLLYALCSAVPFGPGTWPSGVLSPVKGTIAELQAGFKNLEGLMDPLALEFFDREVGSPDARRELKQALESISPRELLPQYRSLASDFFDWMEVP